MEFHCSWYCLKISNEHWIIILPSIYSIWFIKDLISVFYIGKSMVPVILIWGERHVQKSFVFTPFSLSSNCMIFGPPFWTCMYNLCCSLITMCFSNWPAKMFQWYPREGISEYPLGITLRQGGSKQSCKSRKIELGFICAYNFTWEYRVVYSGQFCIWEKCLYIFYNKNFKSSD